MKATLISLCLLVLATGALGQRKINPFRNFFGRRGPIDLFVAETEADCENPPTDNANEVVEGEKRKDRINRLACASGPQEQVCVCVKKNARTPYRYLCGQCEGVTVFRLDTEWAIEAIEAKRAEAKSALQNRDQATLDDAKTAYDELKTQWDQKTGSTNGTEQNRDRLLG